MEKKLFSVAAVGEALGISKYYVWVLIRRGALGHVRLGRRVLVSAPEIERFIKASERPACQVSSGIPDTTTERSREVLARDTPSRRGRARVSVRAGRAR